MNEEEYRIRALSRAYGIKGFLSDNEFMALHELAKECVNSSIVEIGAWKGRSTVALASGSLAGKEMPVYSVDHHTGSEEHRKVDNKPVWTYPEFKQNIENAGVESIVHPLIKDSIEATKGFMNEAVGLIFIDGSHKPEDVKADFEAWIPKLKPGGIMAVHDTTNWTGPRELIKTEAFLREFSEIRLVDSLTIATKKGGTP
jgi:predicted O-methyltransferase YrrM